MNSEAKALAKGVIRWHSSDEDAGPDVGIEIGLGDGKSLYFGELAKATLEENGIDLKEWPDGWWIATMDERGFDIAGPVADMDAARAVADTLASALPSGEVTITEEMVERAAKAIYDEMDRHCRGKSGRRIMPKWGDAGQLPETRAIYLDYGRAALGAAKPDQEG